MKFWRWLTSKAVRQATELKKQALKYLHHQRDILEPENVAAIHEAIAGLQAVLDAGATDKKGLDDAMKELETVANQHIKPYPNSNLRENVEVILVAVAVALAIRTFFLQPFKIPTGSMQPTLYGITHENLLHDPDAEIPGVFGRFFERCIGGAKYVHVIARADGDFERDSVTKKKLFPMVSKMTFRVGSENYTVWNPPGDLIERAELWDGRSFKEGESIVKLKVRSGDHLFVDRFTYNFRRPTRGEIIVFKTAGISGLEQNLFYIKRLVGMPGETVSIGNDHHVRIDGQRLDAATPRFENVYTFDPTRYLDNQYFGHVNQVEGIRWLNERNRMSNRAPLFHDGSITRQIGPNHYMVFGDNTLNSLDSRSWGDFPKTNVIGKSAFVYWPITERFGWSHR